MVTRLVLEDEYIMRTFVAAEDLAKSLRSQFQKPRYRVRRTTRRDKGKYFVRVYKVQ